MVPTTQGLVITLCSMLGGSGDDGDDKNGDDLLDGNDGDI